MTDKELLELAAKAAGITGWQSKHGYWNMTDINGESVVCCNAWAKFNSDTGDAQNPTFADAVEELNWNPLTGDGDALRLAVKLKIGMRFTWDGCDDQYDGVWAETGRIRCDEELGITPSGAQFDEMTATRRAIVRAAAEIGKAMQ